MWWFIKDYVDNTPVMASAVMASTVVIMALLALLGFIMFFAGRYISTQLKAKLTGRTVYWIVNTDGGLKPTLPEEDLKTGAILSDTEAVLHSRGSNLTAPHNTRSFLAFPELGITINPLDIVRGQKTGINMQSLRQMCKWHEIKGREATRKEQARRDVNWFGIIAFLAVVVMLGVIAYGEFAKHNQAGGCYEQLNSCIIGEGKYARNQTMAYPVAQPVPKEKLEDTHQPRTGAGMT
jgi:hypothetical protein